MMRREPLRHMSPLAAAAVECRIKGTGAMDRVNPAKDHKCFVRVQGDLIVRYKIRAAGGSMLPGARTVHQERIVHQEPPQRFDKFFDLYDPDTFFQSYSACRDAIHQMLMQTPLLCEFDLGADNWDHFMPHELATINVDFFRRNFSGVTVRYSMDMTLTIWADILYNEPKALLLAVPPPAAAMPPAECCCGVCMEDLAAQNTLRLPCSHSFHRECIAPWFYKSATCPMCRHDISKYLVAVTNTPKGKFPGLGT